MMTLTEWQADLIMRLCPKYIGCSAPVCPLDLLQDERGYIKAESKCKLSKSKRIKIARQTELPRLGMTKKEWAAYKHWHGLDDTEKARNLGQLIGFSSISSVILSPKCKSNDNRPVDENRPKNPEIK